MFKLPHSCAHLTCQQNEVQNSPSESSTVRELRTSRCSSWIQKRQRNQRSNCQRPLDQIKKQENSRKTSSSLTTLKPLTVWITTNWKIVQDMKIPYHLTCLLRNLYAGQEATFRTGHGTIDWFQIRKGVHQDCILSLCFFNLYAEHIMRNAGLDEAQAGIKIAISITSDMQMTPPLWQKAKRN